MTGPEMSPTGRPAEQRPAEQRPAEQRTTERTTERTDERDELLEAVERDQERKLRSRRQGRPDIARGLGASGIVGWSIAVPTLIGIALGIWLDGRSEQEFSWTLVLLACGLLIGGLTAWYWVRRELEHEP